MIIPDHVHCKAPENLQTTGCPGGGDSGAEGNRLRASPWICITANYSYSNHNFVFQNLPAKPAGPQPEASPTHSLRPEWPPIPAEFARP